MISPDDPRYGRPMALPRFIPTALRRPARSCRRTIRAMAARCAPVYPNRAHRPVRSCGPTIPVRPAHGPPPVIYSDRARRIAGSALGPPAVAPRPVAGRRVRRRRWQADDDVRAAAGRTAGDRRRRNCAPNLRRQEVAFVTKEPAGTIVVDTPNTYLYYVLGNGRAIRYGVARRPRRLHLDRRAEDLGKKRSGRIGIRRRR